MSLSATPRSPALLQGKRNQAGAVSDCGPGTSETNDEVLIARITKGDEEALGELFARYARLVRTVAIRILRDPSEADDLLQEMFLFIYQKGGMFDESKSTARSWIVQMTYHRAIDRRRYLNSRHFYTYLDLNDSLDGFTKQLDVEGRMPCPLVGSATINRLFCALTEDQRHTFNLYFFEGYSFDEIAVELKQSVRNVRNHYYRGLEKLRKQVFRRKLPGGNGCGKK